MAKDLINLNGEDRNKIVKFSISLNFVYKIISVGLSYLAIPLTINYLNSEQYGIWMTLLSILSWMSLCDMGIGNGLRNKVTEALSNDDIKSAKEYISTAYVSMGGIVLVIFIVLVIIVPNLNWSNILNTKTINNDNLVNLIIIVVCFVLFNYVLSIGNQLFYAVQESHLTGIGQLLQNLFLLINILILKKISSGNLIYVSMSYGISMVSASIILSVYFFVRYSKLMPNIKFIRTNKINDILGIGIKFFFIQIAWVVIFTTDNIIISQVLGPAAVTPYNVVQKLFNAVIMVHTIIITPLWSAYTQAYVRGDMQWIRKTLRKLNILMIPIIACVMLIVIFSKYIFNIWLGSGIKFPRYLIIFMAIYSIVYIWSNIYYYFFNGINKLNLQLVTYIIAGFINIPLSIIFSKNLGLGSSGVVLGTVISLSIFALLGPIQTYRIINSKEVK
ncbi:lipopolysaccharide biosynthesis protein [Clostridium felsineum]|uniref:lipopolysaccharide biosynthesis protein n=1 Tax=Clostridium felsineum TaxID=36839 RepID=UPI00098CD96B|nr:oligosaccharide flippase family protein [Clostridium felsineum]URZ03537.1 hypothetical protein CLAUR_035980 [Clostridium felsineum]